MILRGRSENQNCLKPEELLKDEKMKDAARAMIANFDHALSHPDETDLKQAEAFALRVAAMIDAV